jgi:Flp pilus assembly secretin CpaC
MIRALAICALLVLTNRAAADDSEAPAPEPTPISACKSPECKALEQQAPEPKCGARCQKKVEQQALLQQKLAELNCLQTEIDELRRSTGTPQQILIRVQAVEVSRTKLRELGTSLSWQNGNENAQGSAQTASLPQTPNGIFELGVINDGESFRSFIETLQQNNAAKVLAAPTLVVVSGRPASFHVGGEFPVPTPQGSKQTVEFQPYGTLVDVVANALGEDRVRFELRVRVSERDDSRSVEIEGTRVPALHVRQCDSAVELEFGQTGLLTGLVQRRTEVRRTDAGDQNVDNEVELLFIVTPEAVRSIASAPAPSSATYSTGRASVDRPVTSK